MLSVTLGLPSTAQNDRAFYSVSTPGPFSSTHAWVFPGHCPLLGCCHALFRRTCLRIGSGIFPARPHEDSEPSCGRSWKACSLDQEKKGFFSFFLSFFKLKIFFKSTLPVTPTHNPFPTPSPLSNWSPPGYHPTWALQVSPRLSYRGRDDKRELQKGWEEGAFGEKQLEVIDFLVGHSWDSQMR